MLRRLVFIALFLLAACSPKTPSRPDLVLITLDTFRYDRTGYAGNPHGLTPAIDALAEQSTIFENAVTTMSTTFPAHASIFTGQWPRNHGVLWNGDALSSGSVTVAEVLSHFGYETAAFVSYKAMLTRGGLGQGFEILSDRAQSGVWDVRPGYEVTNMAIEWLGGAGEKPFFLWVHYFDTHSPYPLTRYAEERLEGYEGFLADGTTAQELFAHREEIFGSQEHRRALEALYDGTVRQVDLEVGRLLQALRESDRWGNTIVLLAADHGEALGYGRAIGHGGLVREVVARVPLLIRHPNGCAGCSVDEWVGLADLGPTLLDFAGVPAPSRIEGRSLAPAVLGEALPQRRYIVESKARTLDDRHPLASGERIIAVYDGPYKVVRRPDRIELYDVASKRPRPERLDPEEHREVVEQALHHFQEYEREASSWSPTPVEDLPDEVIEELRALGYIQ